jgi:uncharacterized protein YqjF (DUF2071 family)
MVSTVRGRVVDRILFNFGVPAEALARRLPAGLRPEPVAGSAVVSFCVIRIDRATVGRRLPGLWPAGVHCAFRAAVLDEAGEPAVYLTSRHAAGAFGAWLTRVGGRVPHPRVAVRWEADAEGWDVDVRDGRGDPLFSGRASRAAEAKSRLFPSVGAFASFLARGARSYVPGPAGRLVRVDLRKEEVRFEPLAARDVRSPFLERWLGTALAADSAYHTAGGRYEWRLRGEQETLRGAPLVASGA